MISMRLMIVILITWCVMVTPAMASMDLATFLAEDSTDANEYLPWYTCGHFARDLARNASEHNLSIGGAILGNHPVFRGHQNHAVNYIDINGSLYLIEPQTDEIYPMNQTAFRYLRFYPDGTQIPSHWRVNLAHDLDLWRNESKVYHT